jgi:alpha-L-arabinofuranosidase
MNYRTFTILALGLGLSFASSVDCAYGQSPFDGTLYINKSNTRNVAPVKYGFHYEEIGMMGEGALHAELVRNRSFEEATPPAGLSVKNGLYENVPNPYAREKKVFEADPLIGWTTYPLSYSPIFVSRSERNPMSKENRYSMLVNVTADIANQSQSFILNRGYFGMNLCTDTFYRLSLFLRNSNYSAPLRVFLVDELGQKVSNAVEFELDKREWTKYACELRPTKNVKRGMLAIQPLSKGMFQMDIVSMFPADTWDNGKSVFRKDIIQNLREFSPSFIRFPGGCIVHGVNEETMYHWKETLGPIENRPGKWSKWAPYYRTDGIGYHEFYELCEYVGADAMYVLPTGMICTGWVKQTGHWQFKQPEVDIDAYIQDALDAIEYAIGDTSTRWGAERAKNGHLSPFPLKYIEVGNEDFGPTYWERYEKIYNVLSAKYPHLIYIANSIIGKDNDDKRKDIANFVNPANVKVFDEHFYQSIEWACEQHYRFDKYPRGVADIFIGELGIDGKYPTNLLATGAFRMSIERNGDLNPLFAERPVMRHFDFMEQRHGFLPILFNGVDCSVKTSFFYLAKLFLDNTFDKSIESAIKDQQGSQNVFVTMGYDSKSKEYILKLINLLEKKVILRSTVSGFRRVVKAHKSSLVLTPDKENTPFTPDAVRTTESTVSLNLTQPLELEASSMVVYRFK